MRRSVFAAAMLLSVLACERREERIPRLSGVPAAVPEGRMPPGMPMRKEKPVVVPETLKGRWKAVCLVVQDKGNKKETRHVVPLRVDYSLPGTGLIVYVDNLLPHFSMEGGVFTSQTDRMENPAAQVRITQEGQEQFRGWMFMKFPGTHAFEHPKYALKITEFIPA